MYGMGVYLSRDSHSATDDMAAIHATVRQFRHLTSRVQVLGQNIYGQLLFILQEFLMTWTDVK